MRTTVFFAIVLSTLLETVQVAAQTKTSTSEVTFSSVRLARRRNDEDVPMVL